jgi:hypothetical protein
MTGTNYLVCLVSDRLVHPQGKAGTAGDSPSGSGIAGMDDDALMHGEEGAEGEDDEEGGVYVRISASSTQDAYVFFPVAVSMSLPCLMIILCLRASIHFHSNTYAKTHNQNNFFTERAQHRRYMADRCIRSIDRLMCYHLHIKTNYTRHPLTVTIQKRLIFDRCVRTHTPTHFPEQTKINTHIMQTSPSRASPRDVIPQTKALGEALDACEAHRRGRNNGV